MRVSETSWNDMFSIKMLETFSGKHINLEGKMVPLDHNRCSGIQIEDNFRKSFRFRYPSTPKCNNQDKHFWFSDCVLFTFIVGGTSLLQTSTIYPNYDGSFLKTTALVPSSRSANPSSTAISTKFAERL